MNKNFNSRSQVKYIPRNPEKYIGNPDNIFYRSTWEYSAFKFCDNNPNVIKWGSEEIVIEYMKPVLTPTGINYKKSRYYVDLYVEYRDKNGNIQKELIEIKPKKQTSPSKSKRLTTKFVENATYMINSAKWEAAKKWCDMNGVKFCIITEDTLFKR